jgi:hypothetical protein
MADKPDPSTVASNAVVDAPAGKSWPGPLGSAHLTARQRQRLAEDRVLAAADLLDPADERPEARRLRATATSIRDEREHAPHRPDPVEPTPVPRAMLGAAERRWQSLDDLPLDDRAARLAELVWQVGHPAAFGSAYTSVAAHVHAAATRAVIANPHAWATLQPLVAAAGAAIGRYAPGEPSAPPTGERAVTAAQHAAVEPDTRPPWRRIVDAAWAATRTAGTHAGALTAAADVLSGWRARGGHVAGVRIRIDGRKARDWVADLIAATGRDIVTPVTTAHVAPAATAMVSADPAAPRPHLLTAPQLARQDQPPDATSAVLRQRAATPDRQRRATGESTSRGRNR